MTTTTLMRTSVGLKVVMALSGGLLVLFLVAHMLGNLKIFAGATAFDGYAAWLRKLSWYLWLQRGGLTLAVLAHIWSATVLTIRARRARPVRYAHHRPVQGSYAARTMRWGGVIIVCFVAFHLLDLTIGRVNPVGDHRHPYANVVADFAPGRWPVTLLYTLAILAVGLHLSHGIASALRTLGRPGNARAISTGVAVVLCAGYLSVPFAVLTGLVS